MRAIRLLLAASSLLAAAVAASPYGFNYTEEFIHIGDNRYHYLKTEPATGTDFEGTVLLIHGFPDLPFGWRDQINLLSGMGYRVITPSTLGTFPTSAPEDLESYRFTALVNDMVTLIESVTRCGEKIILGGHDWGMGLGWVLTYRHPELIRAIFALSVGHFGPPSPEYVSLEDQIAANQSLNFGYQLQFGDPAFPDQIKGPRAVRKVLQTIYGGALPNGSLPISNRYGINLELLDDVLPAPLLPKPIEDLYVERFTAYDGTIRAPLSYYRTNRLNWEDSIAFQKEGGSFVIEQPTLFICGARDAFVPCQLSDFMDPFFTNLTKLEANTGHWVQNEAADEVNDHIRSFLLEL
jgi:soluble epoxide hydrolase/lipid-phosphate phosphatase